LELDHPATLSFSGQRFRHVFVLCTGRCGSVAFAKACGHFTNYSAGHETNRATGRARLDYPGGHIEIDNRLAWFLGELEERYGDHALYVHLVRDESQVAASYDRRWHHRTSLVHGFDEGICMHRDPGPEAAKDLAATVNANIRMFLRGKSNVMVGDIDRVEEWFPDFAAAIDATGHLDAALAEFARQHNQTECRGSRDLHPDDRRSWQGQVISKLQADLHATLRLFRLLALVAGVSWLVGAGLWMPHWSPWLAVAGVAAILAAGLAGRGQDLRRSLVQAVARTWKRLDPLRVFTRHKLVYDAFRAHRAEGPELAAAILARGGRACPPGARDLFRAMTASSDAEWLAATNAWAAAAGVPEISLRPGPEPRFHRLGFLPGEPVLSRDKVSVIMPAYNARQTVERAARSILDQTWRNLELLIVDDCSTDGTAEVAERLAAEDPRVRVLHNLVNVGPYVSKNRALLMASGRYLTGHDADDIAIPTRIADQMQPIRDETDCVATIASMIRLDHDATFSYPAKVGAYSYDGIARRATISLLIDRELLLEQLGFWDSVRFGADSELFARARALLGPRLREVRKVLMLCLNAEGSLTNNRDHGITISAGVSPVRKAYREAWAAWQAAAPAAEQRLPFPHLDRRFPAPEAMLVSAAAVEAVTAADGAAGRRRAA